MPPTLEALSKGHEFPSVAFDLSSQWVREYAEAVEDGAIAGLGRDMVPPMAVAALSIRALLDSAGLPTGAVHLGQEVAFFRPVGMGERLSAAGRIASRGERQGWVIMRIDLKVEDEARALVMTGRTTVTMPLDHGQESRT